MSGTSLFKNSNLSDSFKSKQHKNKQKNIKTGKPKLKGDITGKMTTTTTKQIVNYTTKNVRKKCKKYF